MTKSRWKTLAETVFVAACGLLPTGLHRIQDWASMAESGPHVLSRAAWVLGVVLSPGEIVGLLVGGCLDIGGFTTDWAYLDRIEAVVGTVANCLLFAAAWRLLRDLPKASFLRRVTLAVCLLWVLGVTPFALLMNLGFADYGP